MIYGELAALGYRGVWASVDADNLAARWVYTIQGNKVVRRHRGHEFFSCVRFQEGRVFLRNTRWHSTRPFDLRLLFSLKLRVARRGADTPGGIHGWHLTSS